MRVPDLLRIPDGGTVDLTTVDPAATPGLPVEAGDGQQRKLWARERLTEVGRDLAELQARLFASAQAGTPAGAQAGVPAGRERRRLLLVLQAMDCGGKDGTVKHVVGQLNPAGVRVVSFGVPSERERKHHFLWRIRRALPDPGYVGVFNRSHYEDVLVPRVAGTLPAKRIRRRYERIVRFEQDLVRAGCTVVKVFLHISPEEQLRRLLARLDDPAKRWKYRPSDVDDRARWTAYREAYRDAIAATSTVDAPWYVVPADRKWYRDWAVAHLLHQTLVDLDPRYPEPDFDVATERARLLAGC